MTTRERIELAREESDLSASRRAELLDISRSSLYYEQVVRNTDKEVMNDLDAIYTEIPFYGARKMRREIKDRHGYTVDRGRVSRLMRELGIEAIYPKKKPWCSDPGVGHKIYPYLLRGLDIVRPNQVWGTDITYVKTSMGFCYLVAIIDWFSRYVVSWELSNSLDASFCIEVLERALEIAIPEIHNSDQGSQFTSEDYVNVLKEYESIKISMDGRGRYYDNIFTERLWRSVKYENVYLKHYQDISEAREGLAEYFQFYNERRYHQALDYQRPAEVFKGKSAEMKNKGRRLLTNTPSILSTSSV